MSISEFGRAVRRWRDRTPPDAVGLPAGGRRRSPGLRREELAGLAGMSVDYVTRLEQGRSTNPSAQVVEALARALRLASAERGHLFELAGLQPPGPHTVPTLITPGVHRILDGLGTTPVVVYDATWTLLAANAPFAALMGHPPDPASDGGNAIRRNFSDRADRVRHTPESRHALRAGLVADLRATSARYPDDPRIARLVTDLRHDSPLFAELWDQGAVGSHLSARKTIDHPAVGEVTLDCDVLTAAGSDLRIMVYTARPGTHDADRLDLITVLGTQSLTDG